jgi:hypothetical protein
MSLRGVSRGVLASARELLHLGHRPADSWGQAVTQPEFSTSLSGGPWRPSSEVCTDWVYRRPMALDLADGETAPAAVEIFALGRNQFGDPIMLRVEGVQGETVYVVRLPEEDWPDVPSYSIAQWRLRGPISALVIERV